MPDDDYDYRQDRTNYYSDYQKEQREREAWGRYWLDQERAASEAKQNANQSKYIYNPPPGSGYVDSSTARASVPFLYRSGAAVMVASLLVKFLKISLPVETVQGLPVWEWGFGVGLVLVVVGFVPRFVASVLAVLGISFVGFAACNSGHGFDLSAVPNGNWVVAGVLLLLSFGLSRWAKSEY